MVHLIKTIFLKPFIAIVILGFSLISYGYFYEPNNVVLEEVDIKKDSLPGGLEDLKLIQFSDLHFKKVGYRENKLRKMINDINPDIIFFTGDLFNSRKDLENSRVVDDAVKFLSSLHFKKHFFVIWGEQEYNFRKYIEEKLKDIHVSVLDNKIYSMEIGQSRLNIIGITEDLKTLDTYYNLNIVEDPAILDSDQGKVIKNNARRFLKFNKSGTLEEYRSYSFYVGGQYSLKWRNYEISGKVKIPSKDSTLGIAFYSQFPMGNFNSYFLQRDPEKRIFYLTSSKGNNFHGNVFSKVRTENLIWISYKIHVRSYSEKTLIKAKIWVGDQDEPESWEIDCTDFGKNKISMGAVGISFQNDKMHEYLGDIRVRMLDYQLDDKESYEGIAQVPLNEEFRDIISEDNQWMTLNEIEKFILMKQKVDKPYILEKKLRKMLNRQSLRGFNILLSHRPNIVSIAEGRGIDLILSGHTQGGQINLPFLGSYLFDEYNGQSLGRGLKRFSDTYLYINRGIGTSVIPFRLRSSPEITLLRLSNQ